MAPVSDGLFLGISTTEFTQPLNSKITLVLGALWFLGHSRSGGFCVSGFLGLWVSELSDGCPKPQGDGGQLSLKGPRGTGKLIVSIDLRV